jgi:phosphate transport system protein
MERQFDQSLKEVKHLLLEMGEKLEIAIDKSVKSLASLNGIMARDVLEKDHKIDELEDRIDEKVAQLIATQQPVAKDLRKLIAAMKIASDMERMADLAANVAEVTVYFVENDLKLFKELKDIPNMARITQKMVHDGINSYIDGNVEMSKKMAQTDDQVDDLYEKVVKELLQMVFHKVDSTDAEKDVALRLCFVARYLERIADHATNIGESIVYIETGKRVDLN